MAKTKFAPFYVFLLNLKDSYKRRNINLSRNELFDLASSEWSNMDRMAKAVWKEFAERKNSEGRQPPPIDPCPASVVPIELRNRPEQLKFRTESFLKLLTRERVALMMHDFVTCSIVPFFKERQADDGLEIYYPGEICLVKWNISNGVKSLYHVYLDPDVSVKAGHVSPREWKVWSSVVACKDPSTIGEEIASFVGNSVVVLVRESHIEKIEACLNYFARYECRVVPAVDQSIIFHNLITRERGNNANTLRQIRSRFNTRTGISGVRMKADGTHTGVRCAWHKNDVFCSARRALEDAFVMTSVLGEVYIAKYIPGSHWLKPGELVKELHHVCTHKIDYSEIIQDARRRWEQREEENKLN